MISWGTCRIFSLFLISFVELMPLAQAVYISVLAVAEAIADCERRRCGHTDPYTDVSLSVLKGILVGKHLLSQLFLYQQIKLSSKTLGMSKRAVSGKEQYLVVLCKSSIPVYDSWLLLNSAGGH